MALPLKLVAGQLQQFQTGDTFDPTLLAVPNTFSANFTIPANSSLTVVDFITMSNNTMVTIPSGSTLLIIG